MPVSGIGSAAGASPVELLVAALTAATAATTAATTSLAPRSSVLSSITYNADGTVATVTESDTGAVITYTYNTDGTPATESRVLGVTTTTRTFTYTSGNLTSVT